MSKLISIVTPCYNEHDNVRACFERVKKVFADQLPEYQYEHIFTDNASIDNTVEILREIAADNPEVKVLVNSRNVGPFRNAFGALGYAKGDAVVPLLAADLQDPPEIVVNFIQHWENGTKVVYGIRAKRDESFLMSGTRKLYYRLVRAMASDNIPNDASEFQLLDSSIVRLLKQVDDYYPYIRGLIAQSGVESVGIPYKWEKRINGVSKNSLYDLFDQGLNGLVSTGNRFIRLSIVAGGLLSILSLLYAVIQLAMNFLNVADIPQPGIATIIVAIFFFGGVQLFFLGVIGEYVASINLQVRRGLPFEIVEKLNIDD